MNAAELARFNQSLSTRLRAEAQARGVGADVVRARYIFTIFLARMFRNENVPWMLLGGNALMIRTGGGRFTQDIDLARDSSWDDIESVRHELQGFVERADEESPFRFEIRSVQPHSEPDPFGYGTHTAKARVVAFLGTSEFAHFSIDLTTRRHVDGPVDRIPLRAVIDHSTLQGLPSVPTIPAENHLADKICAMYELHGPHRTSPSTRYRDLADINRLIHAVALDANRLSRVLRHEEQRREIVLPSSIIAPHATWAGEFRKAASQFAEYPKELHSLTASLRAANVCLAEILSRARQSGRWDPADGVWVDSPESPEVSAERPN